MASRFQDGFLCKQGLFVSVLLAAAYLGCTNPPRSDDGESVSPAKRHEPPDPVQTRAGVAASRDVERVQAPTDDLSLRKGEVCQVETDTAFSKSLGQGAAGTIPAGAYFLVVNSDVSQGSVWHEVYITDGVRVRAVWVDARNLDGQDLKRHPKIQMAQPVDRSAGADQTVYVSGSEKKYHRAGCKELDKNSVPMSLDRARRAYEPCPVCRPPSGNRVQSGLRRSRFPAP